MRSFMQRYPMAGWALAAVLLLGAAYMSWRNLHSDNISQMTEMVTIRCTETGDTWEIPRGVLEKQLYQRSYPIDPNEGIVNPKTGKPTGFPVDDWKRIIERVNADRKALQETSPPPAPQPKP